MTWVFEREFTVPYYFRFYFSGKIKIDFYLEIKFKLISLGFSLGLAVFTSQSW
jgi:hypothetical protein